MTEKNAQLEAGLASDLNRELEALRKENERLIGCLKIANDGSAEFERKWYLVCDAKESIESHLIDELAKQLEQRNWHNLCGLEASIVKGLEYLGYLTKSENGFVGKRISI